MKNIAAIILLMIVVFLFSCNKDEDISKLSDRVEELEDALDSASILKYQDSLNFILALSELEYRKLTDSLRRADSLTLATGGNLPFAYNILVYDGSTTSILSDNGARTSETSAFDEEVTVSVSQFGETRSVATTDGMASFDNIGRGIVKVTVSAPNYTTLQFSFETLIDPTSDLFEAYTDPDSCECKDMWDYIRTGNIGHDVAIFATADEDASTLTGRVFADINLTNNESEIVPEGTVITAAIDVENGAFQDDFILNRNKQIFTDFILSFGYDPIFTAATDADGDYTFTLAGAANENGLPYHFEYSDFLADQSAFVETTGEVTTEAERAAFGPQLAYTVVPNVVNAATVSFAAGGGATATLDFEGDGSIIDIDVESTGANFQGTPRVFIDAPPAGGTQALASATESDGRVTAITIDNAGAGYLTSPGVTITEGAGAAAEITSLSSDGSNGGVADVQVTDGGAGYGAEAPNILFSSVALTGTFATDSTNIANYAAANSDLPTATATLNGNGSISDIAVGNNGSDLTSTPAVIITRGFGATATVTVGANGAITGITPGTPGLYYIDGAPTVSVTGGTGTGAVIETTTDANGAVTTLAILDGGSGYTDNDVINLNAGFTTTGSAVVVSEGLSVESYQITNAGTQFADGLYYTNPPLIEFPEPAYQGAGSARATGTVVLGSDGRVIGITVTDPGSGYSAADLPIDVSVVSGTGALAAATIEAVTITEVDVTDPGNGYLAAPRVEIYDDGGTGSGAVATANLSPTGQVTSIVLEDAGANYSDPQVVIVDPGESYDPTDGSVTANPATATVEVTDGAISAITITSIGDNYPANTNLVLDAPRGTGFAGTVVVAGGQITGVTIDNGGEDYIGGNVPGTVQLFQGINDANYAAKTGITRIIDIKYGSGKRDGEPAAGI